jgi:hypothetical protein
LLPIQLIPYLQYTVDAVIGTLLLGFRCRQMGQRGFFGASLEVDPDSLVTPWLVACWLSVVMRGLQRCHAVLGRSYDLSRIHNSQSTEAWQQVEGYFLALGLRLNTRWGPLLLGLLHRYSRATRQFLFGKPSQDRASIHH